MSDGDKAEIETLKQRLAKAEREAAEAAALKQQAEALNAQLDSMSRHLHEQEVRAVQEMRRVRDRDRVFGPKAQEAGLPDVFDRMDRVISDRGWDSVYSDWVSEEAPQVHQPRHWGSRWSVIPGKGGACNESVMVLVREPIDFGFHGMIGKRWDPIESLLLHLVECQRVKRVMIVSDHFHGPGYGDCLLPWVRAWEQRGVAFALALVAPGGRQLVPVPLGS